VSRAALSIPLFAAACAASSAACSRSEEAPHQVDLAPGYARVPRDAAAVAAAARPKDEPWPGDVDSSAPRALQLNVMRTVVREASAPPVNPDDAILERARVAAGRCFNSIPPPASNAPPERSAHIVFTVIPSGTVSSVDVSSGETDDRLVSCLKQEALSTAFSDNTGGPLRTYAIDVRVSAKGAGAGR
jgi:hypothetical protein